MLLVAVASLLAVASASAAPLRVLSARFDVETVGTAAPAPALSFAHCFADGLGMNSTTARRAAEGCRPRLGNVTERTPLAVVSVFEVAAIRVRFSGPVELSGGTAAGLTRLVCGRGTLVESHPSRVYASDPPLFLVPWSEGSRLPLLPLAAAGGGASPPAADEYVAALVLSHSRREPGGRRTATTVLSRDDLARCRLRFLTPSSQSWQRPGVALVARGTNESFVGETALEAGGEDGGAGPASCGLATAATTTHPAPDRGRARDTLVAERAALERDLAVDSAEEAVLLEGRAAAKFSGVVKGLISGAISPIADLWGEVAGGAMSSEVVDPAAEQVTFPLTEAVTSGVQPFLTAGLVNNIVPSLTETVTDEVIVTLANFLSDALTEHLTPVVVERLTKRLKGDLVKPTTAKIATDDTVTMAALVSATVTRVLGKALPHTVVGALTHTLTHSPQQDYYCFYCYKHKEYCQYCHDGFAPSQLYYSLYYTGYFSSYYTVYFTADYKLGVKVVRPRAANFEDGGAFGSAE